MNRVKLYSLWGKRRDAYVELEKIWIALKYPKMVEFEQARIKELSRCIKDLEPKNYLKLKRILSGIKEFFTIAKGKK